MIVLAIDPGHTESAWVLWDGLRVVRFAKQPNKEVIGVVSRESVYIGSRILAVERVQSMGMAVGEEVFETCRVEARLVCAWERRGDTSPYLLVPRIHVKMHHCGDSRAKDPNIRQALLDRFGPGKDAAIGTKKLPGPLYGVSGDVWSALAIATAVHDVGEKWGWNLDAIRENWLTKKAP